MRPIDDPRLRDSLVAAGARLAARGLIVAAEGNLSVRLSADELLVSPSGRRKDALQPDDFLVVPLDAAVPVAAHGALRPTSDLALHRAVYRARPDVVAYVHAHVPAAMALTLAGETPDPAALPETALFLPRLPCVPFAAMGSDELADAVAAAFAAPPEPLPGAVLLERHGAIAVGSGEFRDAPRALDQALDLIELVDVLCRVWRDALLVRVARGPRDG